MHASEQHTDHLFTAPAGDAVADVAEQQQHRVLAFGFDYCNTNALALDEVDANKILNFK
jgi:hypothetical protein